MSHPPNMTLLSTLLSHDRDEQLSALRTLKNDIVGHVQKKEKWIEAGVLEPIVKILEASRSATKSSRRDSRGHVNSPRPLTGDEAVRQHALQIIASFANGMIFFYQMGHCPVYETAC